MNQIPRSKAAPNRRKFTDAFLRSLKPRSTMYRVWDKSYSGLCVHVTPNGVLSFKIANTFNGKLRWFTVGRYPSVGIAFARQKCRKVLEAAVDGRDLQAEKVVARRSPDPDEGKTLAAVAEMYVERWAERNNKSWRQADKLMRGHVLPTLGKRPIVDIRRKDLISIFDRLTNVDNHPIIANQVLAAVSAVLSWAEKQEIVPTNVARGMARNKAKKDSRFLTDSELVLVWPKIGPSLRLTLVTAQRPGEVCAMRWQDVDLDKAVWTQPGAPADGWPGTKNGRTHDVPLASEALDILAGLEPKAKGPVFPSGSQIPRTVLIWKQLGIPRFRPHHLRATAATGMDALGISEEHIGRVLNHTKGGVTASYIRHDKLAQKRRALEAWGSHLMEVVERRTPESAVVDIRSGKAGSIAAPAPFGPRDFP